MESTRSVGCDHFEEMHVINPKVENIQALRLDDIPFARQTDYIRLTAVTYQSFGLDKNKALVETSALFFVSPVRKRTGEKPLILLGFAQFFFTN